MSKQFTDLIEIIKKTKIDLKFNIIEIGAFKYFNDSAIYRSFDLSFFRLSCYDKKHLSSYAYDWISKVIELK